MKGKITVAVGAVIENHAGEILLVKHRRERGGYWQGKWICPGGKLEVGETIADGIKREVMEETNLEIELVRALAPFERIVSSKAVELHVIYIDYFARAVGGEMIIGSDVGEGKWATKEGLVGVWDELHEDTQILLQIAGIVKR